MSTKYGTGLLALKDKKKHLELLRAFIWSNAHTYEETAVGENISV